MKKLLLSIFLLYLPVYLSGISLDEQFIIACIDGNVSKVTELLDSGANPEARDGFDHQTGLVFSANRGHLSIVTLLVKRGADINASDDKGWTALSEASYRGRTSIVEFLLKNKASTLPSTSWIDSQEHGNAVFWCIESSVNSYREKVEIVKLLLEHNAEPEGFDAQNRDALEIAKNRNYTEIVNLLEKYKTKRIAEQNKYALLEAIRNQDIAKVKIYLDKKVNPNSLLENGESLLNYAVSVQNYGIVKLLLEHGANPNTSNELGTQAVMAAVRYSNIQILNLLISYGVNLNQKDKKGRTALFYAIENNDTSILKMLLNSAVNVDTTDNYDQNAFLYACSLGNISACKILLKSGCQISNTDLYGNTALHIAAQKNLTALVRLIIENGNADEYARNEYGHTPLYYAQKNENQEMVQLLEIESEDELEE